MGSHRHFSRSLRGSALALCALLVTAGCGIGEAVDNECGEEQQAYESLSRKLSGMVTRGVDRDASAYRDTQAQLAEARTRVSRCAGRSVGR